MVRRRWRLPLLPQSWKVFGLQGLTRKGFTLISEIGGKEDPPF
jgi:hypothetical protein